LSTASRAAKYAIDGDATTTWKSANPSNSDEWIELTIAPTAVTKLQFWAGWQATSWPWWRATCATLMALPPWRGT
jgi:hypothetical protein